MNKISTSNRSTLGPRTAHTRPLRQPLWIGLSILLGICVFGSACLHLAPPNEVSSNFEQSKIPLDRFVENWMGYSQAYFQNKTLFEMSLPGTHDTLTYDLSTTVSTAATESPIGSEILKIFTQTRLEGYSVGEFMRLQAKTQVLTLTEQLNAGVRFLDLRATLENDSRRWYGYHFVITHKTFDSYLSEINRWLEAHPTEVVIIWVSHHGDTTKKNQFPFASQADYRRLASMFVDAFKNKLISPADGHPAETPYMEYQKNHKQVVLYLSDFERFGMTAAFDADPTNGGGISNNTGADVTKAATGFFWEYAQFADGSRRYNDSKASKTLYLMSGSTSTPEGALEYQALLHYLGVDVNLPPAYAWLHHCRNVFDLPKETRTQMSCPPTLRAIGRLTNFYLKRSMDYSLYQMSQNKVLSYRMPMAMYLDGVVYGGNFDTGTTDGGPSHPSSKYAYVGSLLLSATLHTTCSNLPPKFSVLSCADIDNVIRELRLAAPSRNEEDLAHGRLASWPPIPSMLPVCARGYKNINSDCYIEPHKSLQGSMCKGEFQCKAPYDGMCPTAWQGHCHGNCSPIVGSCYEDCRAGSDILGGVEGEYQRIRGGNGEGEPLMHTNLSPYKYFICDLSGRWVPMEAAYRLYKTKGLRDYDQNFLFNNGHGSGTKDNFKCVYPHSP